MLVQGWSSSAKRGGLAADVSSGLIFLKKKKSLLLEQDFIKWLLFCLLHFVFAFLWKVHVCCTSSVNENFCFLYSGMITWLSIHLDALSLPHHLVVIALLSLGVDRCHSSFTPASPIKHLQWVGFLTASNFLPVFFRKGS